MAHQVHDCATTHVMTIRIGCAGLKRLIPAGCDGLLRALASLSGGAQRGREPYQEPKQPRQHTLGTHCGDLDGGNMTSNVPTLIKQYRPIPGQSPPPFVRLEQRIQNLKFQECRREDGSSDS